MSRVNLVLAMCLQNGFFLPEGGSYLGDSSKVVLGRISKYLRSVDQGSTDILFFKEVRNVTDPYYSHRATANIVGSPDIQFVDEVAGLAKYILYLQKPSAFHGTQFQSVLKSKDVYRITIVGAETHASVLETAVQLRLQGYDVRVPEPLVTSRDHFLHEAGITLLTAEHGIDVEAL